MRLKEYRLEITVILIVAVFTIIQVIDKDVSMIKTMKGIGVNLLAVISIILQEFWKKRKKGYRK